MWVVSNNFFHVLKYSTKKLFELLKKSSENGISNDNVHGCTYLSSFFVS